MNTASYFVHTQDRNCALRCVASALLAATVLLLLGCAPAMSLHPLSDPATARIDEELLGVWADPKNPKDMLWITRGEGGWHRIFLVDHTLAGLRSDKKRPDRSVLRGFQTTIGNTRFLNVQMLEQDDGWSDYMIVAYAMEGNELTYTWLLDERVRKQPELGFKCSFIDPLLGEKKVDPQLPLREGQESRAALTASPKKLTAFILSTKRDEPNLDPVTLQPEIFFHHPEQRFVRKATGLSQVRDFKDFEERAFSDLLRMAKEEVCAPLVAALLHEYREKAVPLALEELNRQAAQASAGAFGKRLSLDPALIQTLLVLSKDCLPVLIAHLQSDDALRAGAAHAALAALGADAAPGLFTLLRGDGDAASLDAPIAPDTPWGKIPVYRRAFETLSAMYAKIPSVLLIEGIQDKNSLVAGASARLIKKIGPLAAIQLTSLVLSADEAVATRAATLMHDMGALGRVLLIGALGSGDQARRAIIEQFVLAHEEAYTPYLVMIAKGDSEALHHALDESLQSLASDDRASMNVSWVFCAPQPSAGLPADGATRVAAIRFLGRVTSSLDDIGKVFQTLAKHEDRAIRDAAKTALKEHQEIGTQTRP